MQVTLSQGELSLPLLNKACAFLIKRHALLRATIERKLTVDPETGSTLLHTDSSFFVPVRHDPFEFTNVELVTTNDAERWSELVSSDLQTPIDVFKGPLWRLKVVRTATSATHTFIFTFSHVISDGRNMNAIVVELLNILAALIEDKQCVEMNESVDSPVGLEDHLLAHFATKEQVAKAQSMMPRNDIDVVRKRVDLSGTRFELGHVDSGSMSKLIERLKANTHGGKLMGLIEVIVCLAYEQLLAKHGETDRPSPRKYRVSASVREKCGIALSQMGTFVSGLYVELDERLDKPIADDQFQETIWPLAERRTRLLHERLKNNEEIEAKLKSLLREDDHGPLLLDITSSEPVESFCFTNISNFGVLAQCRNTHVLRITELYCIFPVFYKQIMTYMGTVDGALCFALCFHESVFRPELIKEFKDSILTSIQKLIE